MVIKHKTVAIGQIFKSDHEYVFYRYWSGIDIIGSMDKIATFLEQNHQGYIVDLTHHDINRVSSNKVLV